MSEWWSPPPVAAEPVSRMARGAGCATQALATRSATRRRRSASVTRDLRRPTLGDRRRRAGRRAGRRTGTTPARATGRSLAPDRPDQLGRPAARPVGPLVPEGARRAGRRARLEQRLDG